MSLAHAQPRSPCLHLAAAAPQGREAAQALHASRRLVSNTAWLLAAQAWRKACMLLTAIVLARTSGTEAVGRLLAGISFVWMFWILVDGGLADLLTRDGAAHHGAFAAYRRSLIQLKAALAVGGLLAIGAAAWLTPVMRAQWWPVALLGAILVCESLSNLWLAMFRVHGRIRWEAAFWAIDGTVRLPLLFVVLPLPIDPVLGIVAMWLLVSAASCACVTASAWRLGLAVDAGPRIAWKPLLLRSVPIILINAFSLLAARTMVVLVSATRGNAAAGYFGAGERLLEALQILPLAMAQVMLPLSAGLAAGAPERLRHVARRALGWTAVFGATIGLILSAWGGTLMRLVYGDAFHAAGPLMIALGWLALPLCLKPVLEKLLCGVHAQQAVWRVELAGAALSLAAAAICLHRFSLTAGASALLLGETTTVVALTMVWWQQGRT